MEIARSTLLEFIRQLCSAMVHLETKNYVHRDIAARNILVVAPDKIKLSDFGLSRWLEEADFYVGKLIILYRERNPFTMDICYYSGKTLTTYWA